MKENITQGMYGMITVKVTDISFEDIISYIALTHEIKLTEAAYERISQLEVPMRMRTTAPVKAEPYLLANHHRLI